MHRPDETVRQVLKEKCSWTMPGSMRAFGRGRRT